MQYTNLSWFVKAGMLFDLRRYCIIFKTQSFRGRVQCYDTEKDEGVTLIGDLKQQISKTVKYDIQGQVKIDHMCLSPNIDWLFMIQHWTNGIYEGSMNLVCYKRNEKNEWPVFSQVWYMRKWLMQ